MKKICHITSSHKARDQRIFLKQCKSLASEGYDVTLVNRFESFEEDGVKVVGLGYGARSNGAIKSKWKLLQKAVDITKACYHSALDVDADIYQIHDPELLPYGLKLQKKGKIVVFDSHEDYIQMSSNYLVSNFYKYAFQKMQALICTTPRFITDYSKYNENIKMVTNFPMIRELGTSNFDDRRKTISFAGGITPQWNHEQIIELIQDLDLEYILCGTPTDDYKVHLEELDTYKKVVYKGFIPSEEVHNIYQTSTIGVALCNYGKNTNYNLGTLGNTKLFEIMMAGIPVICTDFVLWKEIIEKYHCGITVSLTSKDDIKNAITYLLEHPEEAKIMGKNGRRAVLEEFNWGMEERKLFALYEELG